MQLVWSIATDPEDRSMLISRIEGDFDDVDDASRRILGGLRDRFDASGYVVFDHSFAKRPSADKERHPKWGGYRIQFKIIEKVKYEKLKEDLEVIRAKFANPGT